MVNIKIKGTIDDIKRYEPYSIVGDVLQNIVYRGNPLIDQMAALVDPSITHEVLDQLFIKHQFEQEFSNIELGDLQ